MTVFDIVCGLLLAVGAWKGWRDGIIVQLSGILGLLVGVYLAYRYSIPASRWLGSEGMTGQAAGFLLVFGLVLVALALLGRLMRGLFKFAGLGLFDQLGGAALGIVKVALLVSVLLGAYESINLTRHWTDGEKTERSWLYRPVKEAGELAFPYLRSLKEPGVVPGGCEGSLRFFILQQFAHGNHTYRSCRQGDRQSLHAARPRLAGHRRGAPQGTPAPERQPLDQPCGGGRYRGLRTRTAGRD